MMTSGAREASAGADEEALLFHAKGAWTVRRFPKQSPKVTTLLQEDHDSRLPRTEVIIESYDGLILVIGKCSIPFLIGN